MVPTFAQSSLTQGGVPFALKDGSNGIIAPEARRTYDHIVHTAVGIFPSKGLTDTQARLILSPSQLTQDELEGIWQCTETIDAPGQPDGYWTQLEIYVALHLVQSSEKLSLNQMAVQFAGSTPPELVNGIRRRSSYAEAGLTLRPNTVHDPLPTSPSPATTAILRYSASTATSLTERIHFHPEHRLRDADYAPSSQPGLEVPEPLHTVPIRHFERLLRESSIRTDSTLGAQRLAGLIQSRCLQVSREPEIERVPLTPVGASIVDIASARDILIRKRRENPKFTEPSKVWVNRFKSKEAKSRAADTSTWGFEPHELSLALREVVQEMGNVGVAKALIDMGADVNSVKHVVKSKLKVPRVGTAPINYAKIAASYNNADMVYLFATSNVSSGSLVGALEQAVEQNLPNVVLTLLKLGVDWSSRSEFIFGTAIASQNPTLVRYLLRSRSGSRADVLTSSLPLAVEQGQTEIVSLLMTYGANPVFEESSALRKAVRAQRTDLVLAIMKGVENNTRSSVASSIISEAFSTNSSLTVAEQRLLIDILLCAGAKGDPVAKVLCQVVRARHRSIAKLLIKHGADLHFNNAEALRVAVASEDLDMLSTLLLGRVAKEIASGIVNEIPHACSDERASGILSLLLAKGAMGAPVDKALVRAVERKCYQTMGLLLDHGADVNAGRSQPVRMAITGSDEVALNLLLSKGRPDPGATQYLIPLIPRSPLQLRLAMSETIIKFAGRNSIGASILNSALDDALKTPPQQEIEQSLIPLVDLLIATGASVDASEGKCFRLAAETGSIRLLKVLIPHMSKSAFLSPAVDVCMKMKNPAQRREFISVLLKHGAKGSEINQALIDSVDEVSPDMLLIKSLLEVAEIGYHGGQALVTAMRCPTADLVASIVDTGRTSRKIRLGAWQVLYEPETKLRRAKANILLRAGIGQEGLDDALIREVGDKRNTHIVKMLLDHKASCNYEGGKSLEFAIRHSDDQMLEQLVAMHPKTSILDAMVYKATAIKDVQPRHRCLHLLISGGATGEPISHALVQEIENPEHCDPQLVGYLVDHEARIDYANAKAISMVASTPLHADMLRKLASGTAASVVLASMVPLVMRHSQEIRIPLLQVLLERGAIGRPVDEALVSAVTEGPEVQPTIELLLKYEASVNHNGAQAVKAAALAKSNSVLRCLLSGKPDINYIEEAIPLAMQIPSPPSESDMAERLHAIRLLTQSKLLHLAILDGPLAQATEEGDYELIERLVSIGANPNAEDGKPVMIATRQLDIRSLQLLFVRSIYKPTSKTCSLAFAEKPNDLSRWQSSRVFDNTRKVLIMGGATGAAVDQVFLSALQSSHSSAAQFISLVLTHGRGLNANFEGARSLCIATKRARFDVVAYLLAQAPDRSNLRSAFMCIFESDAQERVLIELVRRYFAHSNGMNQIYFRPDETMNDALYQTLHRHGDKPGLLRELFEGGCRSDSLFPWEFNSSYGAEETSALLWLLCQGKEGIDIHIVDILLEKGADPNFRTSQSRIAPLTMAASTQEADVVLRLLQAGAEPDTQDSTDRSPLQYATMASDISSMEHILQYKADVDDESLHIAARQLDFAAVSILLKYGARTDLPGTIHAGGRTALGEACRMADLTLDSSQLRKVIALLCTSTKSLRALTHGRSIAYHALDNRSPIKMATALLASCPSIFECLNEDFNVFASGSLRYSPTGYVRHFRCIEPRASRCFDFSRHCCTRNACPAPDLENLLRSRGCRDRFWDAQTGANQPAGFCNPPADIIAAIEEANTIRAEAARKDRIKRDLDAAAAADRRREKERLEILEQERAAELRAVEQRAAAEARAIRQRAKAEADKQRRLAAAESERAAAEKQREDQEYNTKRERERQEQHEKERRERERDQRAERTLRERKNVQIDQKRRETNLRKEELREEKKMIEEKKRLADSMAGMFREAQHAGVSGSSAGRILGEIEN